MSWLKQEAGKQKNPDSVLAACSFSFALSSPAAFSDLWVGQTPSSPIPPPESQGNSSFPFHHWSLTMQLFPSACITWLKTLLSLPFICNLLVSWRAQEGFYADLGWSLRISRFFLLPGIFLDTESNTLRPKLTVLPAFCRKLSQKITKQAAFTQ